MKRLLLPAVALALAACSGGSTATSPPVATTPPATATPTTAPPTTAPPSPTAIATTSTPKSTACTTGGPLPAKAITRAIPDVDGDGKADTGFIVPTASGAPVIGVHTAAGGTFSADFDSASGAQGRTVTFFAVTAGGPFVAVTDDNRQSLLFVVQGCSLKQPVNPQHQPYTFDLGNFSGNGDGVTCGTVAGGARTLIGFHDTRDAKGQKTGSETRTAVLLAGYDGTGTPTATNGKTDTTKGTPDPVGASCGSVTEKKDGISLPAN